MTLAMPDSTDVSALPPGYGQYLGYVDGDRPTWADLRKRFPDARIVALTVTGATLNAQGCDIEPGNLTAKDGAQWARQKLNRQPASRPVLYASVIGEPGYGMGNVRDALVANSVPRGQVRLLSAHYGAGEHICGPGTCGAVAVDMDGTQWTDQFWQPGPKGTNFIDGGAFIDMSVLVDGFFGTWTEEIVGELPVVQLGDSGEAVRTIQGLILARGHEIVLDGIYGAQTGASVRVLQSQGKVTVDGVVGPQTWPVLLGIA